MTVALAQWQSIGFVIEGLCVQTPLMSHVLYNFFIFELAITFFSGFEGSTNFHILMHMSIRSYHINKNSGASWSLFLILLSKSHIFSPKKLGFFSVKIFWWVLSTFQWYHSGPLLSAVLRKCQTQFFWSFFLSL